MTHSDTSPEPKADLDYDALHRYVSAGRTARNITHDVNNFLGAILAYSELVELDPGIGEESKRMLMEATKAVQQSAELLRTMSLITKSSEGPAAISSLESLLKKAIDLCGYEIKVRQIELAADLAEGLPSIELKESQVALALTHLLLNALEQCAEMGTKRIFVELRRDGGFLEVRVQNTDSPVPTSRQAKMFEPRYTTKADGHLGLGLSDARRTAQAHGGSLLYDGERGFIFRLPLAGS